MSDQVVRHRPEASRYELVVDGSAVGFVAYVRDREAVTFVHTEIDDAYEGQGLASVLVRGALDDARSGQARQLRNTCPFISTWLSRHPEYEDVLDAPREDVEGKSPRPPS